MLNKLNFNSTYYGVVEDRKDPLNVGRCRVRVVGIHTFDKNEIPTEALPWAPVISSAGSITVPKEGEYVSLLFLNGNTDTPIILGVMPGIVLVEAQTQTPSGSPKPVDGVVLQKVDAPTTPSYSRGDIENTPIQIANQDKEHVCNISYGLKLEIIQARLKVSAAIQWLREKIQKLFSGLSQSAFAQSVQAKIKQLLAELKKIQRIIKEFNDFVIEVAKLVQQIKDLIVWILSLPSQLLAFLQGCLTEFLSSIGEALTGGFGGIVDDTGTSVVIGDVVQLVQTSVETVQQASSAAQNVVEVAGAVIYAKETFERV